MELHTRSKASKKVILILRRKFLYKILQLQYVVKIIEIFAVTHDAKCFRIERPEGFTFLPGQATDLSVNRPGMEENTRPFTFTALSGEPYLEFTIKRYPEHHGVTDL